MAREIEGIERVEEAMWHGDSLSIPVKVGWQPCQWELEMREIQKLLDLASSMGKLPELLRLPQSDGRVFYGGPNLLAAKEV